MSAPASPPPTWDTTFPPEVSVWTRRRSERWRSGPNLSFLGFANFYHQFIRSYSTIAAPLTLLTLVKVRSVWDEAAEKAFRELKRRLVSAPILVLPDQSRFIMEVDVSDGGVGAILSQHSAGDSKVHPCAFYSHCLSPGEQNYDIGN